MSFHRRHSPKKIGYCPHSSLHSGARGEASPVPGAACGAQRAAHPVLTPSPSPNQPPAPIGAARGAHPPRVRVRRKGGSPEHPSAAGDAALPRGRSRHCVAVALSMGAAGAMPQPHLAPQPGGDELLGRTSPTTLTRYRNPKLASQGRRSSKSRGKPPTAEVLLVRLLEHSPPTPVM